MQWQIIARCCKIEQCPHNGATPQRKTRLWQESLYFPLFYGYM
ncbi:hypothetical protein [Symbiopectobacterium purcellii]|nr:hypothetical protein [Symbiopectobacterium purcellii]